MRYQPAKSSGMIWKDPRIGINCLVFSTGKMVLNARVSVAKARCAIRKYARLVQKAGFDVKPRCFRVVTRSAVHTLKSPVDYSAIVERLNGHHHPEIFHAVTLRRGGLHFIIFKSQKVLITGIKSARDMSETVRPLLRELERWSEHPMADWKDYLEGLYYDPNMGGSLAGPKKLHQLVRRLGERRIGLRRIKRWLSEAGGLHHAERRTSHVQAESSGCCWTR